MMGFASLHPSYGLLMAGHRNVERKSWMPAFAGMTIGGQMTIGSQMTIGGQIGRFPLSRE
jgi:hypothetical protein